MKDFFKVLLRGIVVTLLLPFILAFLILAGVYCLFAFLGMFIRNLIVFFKGGDTSQFKEDKIAAERMAAQEAAEADATQTITDLMHSAIKQNPEAIQAMAQQEIASQKLDQETNKQSQQVIDASPVVTEVTEVTPIEDINDSQSNKEFGEEGQND